MVTSHTQLYLDNAVIVEYTNIKEVGELTRPETCWITESPRTFLDNGMGTPVS